MHFYECVYIYIYLNIYVYRYDVFQYWISLYDLNTKLFKGEMVEEN